MDIRTGEIITPENYEELNDLLKDEMIVSVNETDMTAKQKREKQVSLKDHKSKLGKILTKNRRRKLKRKGLLK